MNGDRPFWRSPSVLLSLAALVAVVVTDAVLRHLGGKASDFTLFVGRFHPLVVHLPIGFVLLVAAAEAATLSPRLRARVDPVIALALPLVVAAAATAFVLGHLLARSGDFAPNALNVHRRFELFASVGLCLCPLVWEYQTHAESERARWGYRALLGVALGVLSVGAHFGGTLTRGDTYLTRYAPEPLKRLMGAAPKPAASASAPAKQAAREPRLFADVIQPILKERCVSCHGEEKSKGGLRLDSLAALQKGGEDGAVVTPGNPGDSPLLGRVLLPPDDDDHMPPEGKPGLTAPEIAAVRFWIERGAGDTLLVRDLLAPSDAKNLLERALGAAPSAKTPTAVAPRSDDRSAPAASAAATDGAAPARPAPPTSAAPAAATPAATTTPAPAATATSAPAATATHASDPPSTVPTKTSSSATALFSEHCVKCHGPEKQKGKLRVDSLDALLQGGKSGPAVVPGNASASTLVKRLNLSSDDDQHMPPAKEPQLTAREIALVSGWVANLDATSRTARSPATAVTPPATAATPPSTAAASRALDATNDAGQPSASATTTPAATSSTSSPDVPPKTIEPPSPGLLAKLPSHLALYPSEVAPLLRSHCAACHGGKTPAGGLDMTDYAALLRGGDTGPAVTPGKPEQSVLVYRIRLPASDDDHMPPSRAPQLTPKDIALVSAWVERDGTQAGETALETLPGPAVEAIAEHPPARSASDVARASPPPRTGGCGACAVGSPDEAPAGAALTAVLLVAGLAARRRGRSPAFRAS